MPAALKLSPEITRIWSSRASELKARRKQEHRRVEYMDKPGSFHRLWALYLRPFGEIQYVRTIVWTRKEKIL